MYRCTVDNAVTYTSEDFALFRESPFACWMERLTLENPDHGIPADLGSVPPGDSIERQDDMADTLRAEGKDVCLIDWDADEATRRSTTLDAMRKGADFIVNGQLALGSLSSAANLLMRTSGYSQLGDFLYIPCDTQARNTQNSAFRLCFLADLLHSLQGQMPPQMLIIRGGDDLIPLQTDNYIYHYRAVKQLFMESMRGFRKHRMPDPAASSHFGRWSDCAHEVLKQRMLNEDDGIDENASEEQAEQVQNAVAVGAANEQETLSPPAVQAIAPDVTTALSRADSEVPTGQPYPGAAASFTLAEQARMLQPGAYKPGPGVYRLGTPRHEAASPSAQGVVEDPPAGLSEHSMTDLDTQSANEVAPDYTARARTDIPPGKEQSTGETADAGVPSSPRPTQKHNRRASDAALQNLEFIGSSMAMPGLGLDTAPAPELPALKNSAPAPSLRDPRAQSGGREPQLKNAPPPALGMTPRADAPLDARTPHENGAQYPVEESLAPKAPIERNEYAGAPPPAPGPLSPPDPVERPAPHRNAGIDMDGAYPASPAPGLTTRSAELAEASLLGEEVKHGFGQAAGSSMEAVPVKAPDKGSSREARPFSDSIFNNRIFTEGAPDDEQFSDSLMTSDDYDS